METNRLRQFCLIVETGSISRAAELLRITHSALSKSMTTLQDELKLQILQPSGRGISVTHDGVRIYNNAKTLLQLEKELIFSSKSSRSEEIRIGTVEIFNSSLLDGLEQLDISENIISVMDVEPGTMEQQIAAGRLDYGVTYLPFPQPSIRMTGLGSFKLGVFHLENAFKDLDFVDIPFVVPSIVLPENPQGIKERDGWHDSLFPRKIRYRTNLLSSAIGLVVRGHCAIVLPHFVAHQTQKLLSSAKIRLQERMLPLKAPTLSKTAYILSREDTPEDRVLRKLCRTIRTHLQLKL